jgi:hypothetical protein
MPLRRTLTALFAAAIAAQAVALCALTGWHPTTRYPSPEIAAMNSSTDLEQAFASTGLNARQGEIGRLDNRFAFGWLPGSLLGPELLCVATLGGPAALLLLVSFLPSPLFRRRTTPRG